MLNSEAKRWRLFKNGWSPTRFIWLPKLSRRLVWREWVRLGLESELAIMIGLILRNSRDNLVKGLSTFERATFNLQIVEVFDISEALLWLKSCHLNHAIIDSDCVLVVHVLNRSVVDNSKFSFLILDCLMLGTSFQHLCFCWVHQLADKATHSLSRLTRLMGMVDDKLWVYGVSLMA
ncbi:hypothetical protein Godav_005947 [Gossypium davidsonii]|uniref:RNase H type-1 domain-containing protein n=2 Tax=Gossypium TaxID=3633 RepID=A0A7J8S2A0_GOSDV|nr:hypothetical protein [Gossypium davidsonii]